MANWDTISPKFTPGNQWVYWTFLYSMNETLLTGVWAISPQKTDTGKSLPRG